MRTKETEDAERVRKRFEPNSTDNMLNDPLRFFAFSGSSVALGSNSSYSMQVSTGKQRGIGMARDERRMNPKSVRVDRRERKRAPRNFYVTCKDNGRILFDPGSSSIKNRRGKSSYGHAATNGRFSFSSKRYGGCSSTINENRDFPNALTQNFE